MFRKCLLITLVISVCHCDDADKPQVKTPLGKIRGYSQTSHGGRKFSTFEGIPYAKPPIGNRRFEEPEPIEPWSGVWNAIFLTECVQTGMIKPSSIQGEEDCLYINVYVPREKPNPKDKLDVVVHIHGGAYMFGSGHSYAHPEYLMDRELIFVTFNYRLGIFGFLSTEDSVVSGNNGLKDQVLALKWVQENIASFGGNPDSVTLTGLSAGGSSVHLHYLSPSSKGLFHRGFSQSGSALNSFTIQEEPLSKARLLGEAMGCPSAYSQVLVQCLKQRNYKHLISKVPLFYGHLFAPFAPFAPVIEKGANPFLNKNPYDLLAKGQVQDLPWIASNTAHEGLFPTAFLFKDLELVNKTWDDIAPYLLDYNYTIAKPLWKSTAQKIRQFYLGDEEITNDNFPKLTKIFTDRLFLVDSEVAVKLQAKATKSPVYYYYFGYAGEHSKENTVAHADDAQYFFYNMFQRKKAADNELKMKDVMLEMLVSFAKTGKPTIKGVNWEPTSYDELTYLNITGFESGSIKLQRTKQLAPEDFWKSLGFLENENLVPIKDEL